MVATASRQRAQRSGSMSERSGGRVEAKFSAKGEARRRKRSTVNPASDAVGVYYGEVPPVPIPNTEVKLICADDTWLVTARENRSSPT